MGSTRKLTFLALLAAAAAALQALEAPLPRLLPWAKLGLANSASLLVLLVFGLPEALLVVAARQALAGLLLGQFLAPAFWLGCTGALAAALAMAAALRAGRRVFGLLAVSMVGALANNVAQLVVAQALLVSHGAVWWNLPLMLAASVPAGGLVGWMTLQAHAHLPPALRERDR